VALGSARPSWNRVTAWLSPVTPRLLAAKKNGRQRDMDPFLGEIRMTGFNFAPIGWALCNGQLLAVAQYSALFDLLGTAYGGNGVNTFALPNLQSRVPIHQGQGAGLSAYVTGQEAGAERVTLSAQNLPAHSHTLVAQSTIPATENPNGAFLAAGSRSNPNLIYTASTGSNVTMNPQAIQPTGASQPVGILPPYLCINFIIALEGIFPSRS
jgi:microcystin-dependent protein